MFFPILASLTQIAAFILAEKTKKEPHHSQHNTESLFFWFLVMMVFCKCAKQNKVFVIPLAFVCGAIYYVYQM